MLDTLNTNEEGSRDMSVDKKWLIKSDNKIVGPYSMDQLENLLLQDFQHKQVHLQKLPE